MPATALTAMRIDSMVSPEIFIAEATLTSGKSQIWRSAPSRSSSCAPAHSAGRRIAVSISPACSTVMRVMSIPGPMKNSSAFTTCSPRGRGSPSGVERDQRRRRVGRIDRHAAARAEDAVLAVHRSRRVGVADVAAGAVAGPTAAVVPAARVLAKTLPPRVPWLRICGVATARRRAGAGRTSRHQRVAHHLGEGGHGADLEAATGGRGRRAATRCRRDRPPPSRTRSLNQSKVSRPPASAQASCRTARAAPPRPRRRRLEQLEAGHHVADHGHGDALLDCAVSGSCCQVVASIAFRIMSSVIGVRPN